MGGNGRDRGAGAERVSPVSAALRHRGDGHRKSADGAPGLQGVPSRLPKRKPAGFAGGNPRKPGRFLWSGKRDSNPRPSAWEAVPRALLTIPEVRTPSHRLSIRPKTQRFRNEPFRTRSHRPHGITRRLVHPWCNGARPGRRVGRPPKSPGPPAPMGSSLSGRSRRTWASPLRRSTGSAAQATCRRSGLARRSG